MARRDRTPWKVTLVLGGKGYAGWSSHGRRDLAVAAAQKLAERIRAGESFHHAADTTEIRVSDGTQFVANGYHYQRPTDVIHVARLIAHIPEHGMEIERLDRGHSVAYSIYEDGVTWPDSDQPRAILEVDVYKPDMVRSRAEVSWPSTSDKRPALAIALSIALRHAAVEAEQLNEKAEVA